MDARNSKRNRRIQFSPPHDAPDPFDRRPEFPRPCVLPSPCRRLGRTGSWDAVSPCSIRYVEVLLATAVSILRHGSGVPGTCGSCWRRTARGGRLRLRWRFDLGRRRALRQASRVLEALFLSSPSGRLGRTGSWDAMSPDSIRYVEVLLAKAASILRHGSGVPGTCGSCWRRTARGGRFRLRLRFDWGRWRAFAGARATRVRRLAGSGGRGRSGRRLTQRLGQMMHRTGRQVRLLGDLDRSLFQFTLRQQPRDVPVGFVATSSPRPRPPACGPRRCRLSSAGLFWPP